MRYAYCHVCRHAFLVIRHFHHVFSTLQQFRFVDALGIAPGVSVTKDFCLLIGDGPTMVIGDLHLGYEKALESDGLHIPRLNTASVRESLNRAISDHSPEAIVLLGDIKHDFRRPEREVREEVLSILTLLTDTADVAVVRGNHDNFLQNMLSDVGLFATDRVDLHGYRLEHGHEDSGKRPVVIGHEHPSVRIRGSVHGDVKIPCFLHFEKEGIIVVPPFSPFPLGADLSPSDPEQFMSPACRAADAGAARVYGVTEIGVLDFGELGEIGGLEL